MRSPIELITSYKNKNSERARMQGKFRLLKGVLPAIVDHSQDETERSRFLTERAARSALALLPAHVEQLVVTSRLKVKRSDEDIASVPAENRRTWTMQDLDIYLGDMASYLGVNHNYVYRDSFKML